MRATFIILSFLTLSLALLPVSSALAEKGGKGREYSGPPAKAAKHKADSEVFGFNDKEAEIITGVLHGLFGEEAEIVRPSREFCPPGLAKKNNGCMPPGLVKKYTVGKQLPEDVAASALTDVLRDVLGVPPRGRKYVQVDNDVLLIEEGTRLVLDAIGLRQ